MLRYALDACKDFGLEKVTVGCYNANIASAKVITKCGGILIAENDNYEKGKLSQYYEIRLRPYVRLKTRSATPNRNQ